MILDAEGMLIGVDMDASRVLAVGGTSGQPGQGLALDDGNLDLPMTISLEGRTAEAGRAGVALCRRLPHLVCLDFLHELGEEKEWRAGKHRLSAVDALTRVFERMAASCVAGQGLAFALPAYLDRRQVAIITNVAERTRVHKRYRLPPVLGSVMAPLAVALTAYAEQPWSGLALVLDADEHALTLTTVNVAEEQAQVLDGQVMPHLNLRAWKEKLLDIVADHCVRQSRRDPRDSAVAEQSLYEQFDEALELCRQGQPAELVIHTGTWYQNLLWRPEELAGFCAPLVQQVIDVMQTMLADLESQGPLNAVLVTAAAGRLPGLVAALEENIAQAPPTEPHEQEEDFGLGLFSGEETVRSGVHVLSPDAAARAAYELAIRFQKGDLPTAHLRTAPLLPPQPAEAGPARLLFRGQDYLLTGHSFTLGRHPSNDLVFDTEQYPAVAARHCEFVLDQGEYLLCDLSRTGTFVNDRPVNQSVSLRPGDWIRLGPDGPILRFLGRADHRQLTTTA